MLFVYIAQVPSGPVKIGITAAVSALKRVDELRFFGERASLRAAVGRRDERAARDLERTIHAILEPDRLGGEWFRSGPGIESLARSWGGSLYGDARATQPGGSVFGANLRAARVAAGLSEAELAIAASLHLDEVSTLERGSRSAWPSMSKVKALASALGIDPHALGKVA